MRLRVPGPSNVKSGNSGAASAGTSSRSGNAFGGSNGRIFNNAFASDQAKIAVLSPAAAATAVPTVARPEITVAVETPRLDPAIKTNYDGVKVFDPRTTLGSVEDQVTVNNALIIKIPSNISRTASFVPTSPTDPAIRAVLEPKTQVINLSPTASVAGETTLSSTALPEVRIVTYEPTRVMTSEPTFNQDLANTIKTSSTETTTRTTTTTIKSTLCATCIKSLSLITP
jgi:hypothetical protein